MDPTPRPKHSRDRLPPEAEVNPEPKVPNPSQTSSFLMNTRSSAGRQVQPTTASPVSTGSGSGGGKSIIRGAAGPASAPPAAAQPSEDALPLRLALARRSVKRQIFTYMDRGDNKADIESRTGLSHNCVKFHRRLWRVEGRHPRAVRATTATRSPSPSARARGGGKKVGASGPAMKGRRRRRMGKRKGERKGEEFVGVECGPSSPDKENLPLPVRMDESVALVGVGEVRSLPFRGFGSC